MHVQLSDKLINQFVLFRKLLGFGQISWYLGYNALSDFFPSMMIKPNPSCSDNFCMNQQVKFQNRVKEEPEPIKEDSPEDQVIHDNNDWGRSIT